MSYWSALSHAAIPEAFRAARCVAPPIHDERCSLVHATLADVLDEVKDEFLWGSDRETPYPEPWEAIVVLKGLHERLRLAFDSCGGARAEIWSVLSMRQMDAVKRFTTLAFGGDPNLSVLGNSETIIETFKHTIHPRHPELGLQQAKVLIAFLRNPRTPFMLRGLQTGGSGWVNSLQFLHRVQAGRPWRDDPTKPVLETGDGVIRVLPEVRQAATQHRIEMATATEATGTFGNGLPKVSMANSAGCPARFLRFTTRRRDDLPKVLGLPSGIGRNGFPSALLL